MLPGTPTEGTPSKDRCGCCGRITYKKVNLSFILLFQGHQSIPVL